MANRPIFMVLNDNNFVVKIDVKFKFYSGFSEKQKMLSIQSLHESFLKSNKDAKVLEISTKSDNELGIKLSAFNLKIKNSKNESFTVETAFQAGKIFEKGGPYTDLLYVSSREAKRDERLRNSGKIIGFSFDGKSFSTEPKTLFYNWIYINALAESTFVKEIVKYDAFTDIEFNPQKSINCQAEAAAIFVSLHRQNLINAALKDEKSFLEIVYNKKSTVCSQISLFD